MRLSPEWGRERILGTERASVRTCTCVHVCVCVRQREIYPTTSFLEGDLRQKEAGGSGEKTGEGGEDQTVKSLNPLDMAGKVRE